MFSVLFPVLISSIQRGNKGRKVTDLGGKFSATHKIEEMGEKKKVQPSNNHVTFHTSLEVCLSAVIISKHYR